MLQKVPKNLTLVQKNIHVKILLHINIQTRKAALARNYFFRRNNFHLNGFQLPSLSLSLTSDFQLNKADILFRRVNYLYLATFTCPIVFLYPVSSWMAVNGVYKCSLKSTTVYTWSNFNNIMLRRKGRYLLIVRG